MQWFIRSGDVAALVMTSAFLLPIRAQGQDSNKTAEKHAPGAAVGASQETIQTITDDYNQQLLALDRRRMERLSNLAARQEPAEAATAYEQLFRLAIAGNLFREAEAAAATVISKGSPSAITTALAHLVKIIAESDRGAYEQSLESLRKVIEQSDQDGQLRVAKTRLLTTEKQELCDAYFQRLIHADQYEIARKAFRLLRERAQDPAFGEFLAARLSRLEQVGKPAPALVGTDLDGKKFNLADAKGKVVLVVFWASWCLPSAGEVDALCQLAEAFRAKGLQVIGVNVDILQDGGQKLETVMPAIRRFLIDHNVSWPNLVNGTGDQDYARAFGVTEIPANVLIARDGTIASIDLVPKNLESSIVRLVGQ